MELALAAQYAPSIRTNTKDQGKIEQLTFRLKVYGFCK
jgi:hypothetical protein